MGRAEKNQFSLISGSIIAVLGGALLIRSSNYSQSQLIPWIMISLGLVLAFLGANRKW